MSKALSIVAISILMAVPNMAHAKSKRESAAPVRNFVIGTTRLAAVDKASTSSKATPAKETASSRSSTSTSTSTSTFVIGTSRLIAANTSTPSRSSTSSKSTTSRSTTSGSTTSAGAGTSTASLKTNKKSFWKRTDFQLFSQSYFYQNDIANGYRPLASTYNYVGVQHEFMDNNYFSVRVQFSHYTSKFTDQTTVEMEDVYLSYWNARLARIGRDTRISSTIRLYLPTGEDSRFLDRRQGAIRGTLMVSHTFNNDWNGSYFVYGQYNRNSIETYEINDVTYSNIDTSVVQGATIEYDFTNDLSLSQMVGTTSNFADTGNRYSTEEHEFNSITSLWYRINRKLSVSAAVHNDVALANERRPFKLGMNEDLSYVLTLAASL